jgi:hypothetical protein
LIVPGALELPNLYTNFKKRFLNFNNLLFTPDIEIALQGSIMSRKLEQRKENWPGGKPFRKLTGQISQKVSKMRGQSMRSFKRERRDCIQNRPTLS